MKYIDAEKLIAEIDRRKGFYWRTYERLHRDDLESSTSYAIASALEKLLSFITSLQQERSEVDLDSTLTGFFGRYAYENGGEYPSAIDIAKHFYELGLNARKEE